MSRDPQHAREAASTDPAALLVHAAWMRGFAIALAGSEGEDLAQEAWVRLLGQPRPALERPRAWLARTLRNAARSKARSEGRRTRREEQHAETLAEPSSAELVARAELEQLAVRAVLALDEPYREALLLRYLRGLEPHEIARRLGLAPSTVRTHLARGLALVRARLDAKHGGRREAWLALIVPFERALAPATALGGGTATAVVAGGAFMAMKWLAGGAALVLAGLWWWNRGPGERAQGVDEVAATNAEAALSTPGVVQEAEPVLPAREPREALDTPLDTAATPMADGATASLDVRVSFARDGAPAAGCTVEVLSWDAPLYPRARTGVTDPDGRVEFLGLEPGQQFVEEQRADGKGVEVAAGETRALELVIPLGIDVDVRVVDIEGLPVSRAEVWLSDYANSTDGGVIGHTGADGRFFVRDVGRSRSLAARADGHVPSAQRDVIGNPGDALELTLELRGPGAALAGIVRGPDGEPVAGAEVLVDHQGPSYLTMPNGEVLTRPPPVWLVCDALGRFEARGLEPGACQVQARAPSLAWNAERVELIVAETTRVELTLFPSSRVGGRVSDGLGRALADVVVASGRYMDFDYVRTNSADDGSFVLDGLRPGSCELRASSDEHGTESTRLQVSRAGEDAEWNPVLVAGPSVAGIVLDERGEPLVGWHVAAVERTHLGLWLRSGETASDGRFRLVNCPTVPFVIAVRSPADMWGAPVVLVEEFQPGTELVVRVPDDAHPTAFVSGRVRASDGRELEQVAVAYQPVNGSGYAVYPDAEGRFRIGPLRAGSYGLQVSAAGLGTWRRGLELEPRQELELGWLTLEPASQLVVRATGPEGAPSPQGAQTQVFLDGQRVGHVDILESGEGRSQPLAPGRYTLRTRCWNWFAPEVELELGPGETRTVELALQPATNRQLRFVPPAGDGASDLRVLVRDELGTLVWDHDGFRPHQNAFVIFVGGLLPGRYSFEARTNSGRTATGTFHVPDLLPSAETLQVPLR